MKQSAICFIIFSFITVACFEEDQRVPPYPGKVSTITDSVQTHVSYFDFETNRVVRTVEIQSWQLGFECGATGWHIITNSGANWFIYNTEQSELDAVLSMPESIDNLYDMPSYFPDSTAVGDWTIPTVNGNTYTDDIYLLGYHNRDRFTLIRQVIFQEVNDTSYRFFFKDNDEGISDTVTILKNDTVNYVYFSFDQNKQVSLEPDKTTWDLAFGPYYDLATLFGSTIPYLVGGSFLNLWQTEATLDSVSPFDAIHAEMIGGYQFTSQRDIPGYRWKGVTVDVTGGGSATYAVKTNYNYIFHTAGDNYFKLKFLSYTLDGHSGFPQFEFRQLE
jgi:hypothetical protein